MFRQGDVLLKPIKKLKGKKVAEHRYTLAYGEKTGHHHDIVGDVEVFDNNRAVLVYIGHEGAILEHQEHEQINVPPGIYEVVRQREYTLLDEIRSVRD